MGTTSRFVHPSRYRAVAGVIVSGLLLQSSSPPAPLRAAETLRLGAVQFDATGAAEAQPHFQAGVAALHSFWYDEALAGFRRAIEIDPKFAMAWWGIAMAYHRPYLPGSDDAAGRRALARIVDLAPLTRREQAYIAALRAFYSEQELANRTLAYAAAMARLHRDYPNDLDAAAFYALSLLGYHWSTDEGFDRQEKAAAVAEEVYRRNPQHPGAAHYIIHSLDTPTLAARALAAARQYSRIAPDAPHALHMPSHIYLQLGLWPEAAAANEAGWAASESWVQRKRLAPTERDYHNLHWLIYSYLQQGRYAQAGELVGRFQKLRQEIAADSLHFLHDALAAFVVETRAWGDAESLFAAERNATSSARPMGASRVLEVCGGPTNERQPSGPGAADMPHFIRAFAGGITGLPEAEELLASLRRGAVVDNVIPKFWQMRILQVTAANRARRGDLDGARSVAAQAAAIEDTVPAPPGPPSSIKPANELLGELLLASNQPAEAIVHFNRTLARHPNRALAVLGLARAEAAAQKTGAAVATYRRFLDLWQQADTDRPELTEARKFVARTRTSPGGE